MVYTMMLSEQKERLHEIYARWYEKYHRSSPTFSSVIIHHWTRSKNTRKKVSISRRIEVHFSCGLDLRRVLPSGPVHVPVLSCGTSLRRGRSHEMSPL